MEPKFLPLLMMALFLVIVLAGRVGVQLASVGDSGIRAATKLKSSKAALISYLMFGTLIIQLLLAIFYAAALITPQITMGGIGTWLGIALCITGILFASYSQLAMGTNWRIGVDPDEDTDLVTTGIYSKIRNPIYTASMMHGLGLLLLMPHVLMLVTGLVGLYAITAYVWHIEEPYLINLHGEKYQQYMKRTGSFLPRLKIVTRS